MSKHRIEMTDTEVFAELQRVYADFNNDLNDFIEKNKTTYRTHRCFI
ncbi:hypothetical protein [Gilliamella sp. BG7]